MNNILQKLKNINRNTSDINIDNVKKFSGMGLDIVAKLFAGSRALNLTHLQSSRYTPGKGTYHYHNGVLTQDDGTIDPTTSNNDVVHSGSTAIESIRYDPKTESAEVTYKSNGKKYLYPEMSHSEFQKIADASSKGRAMYNFNKSPSNVCHGQGAAAAQAYLNAKKSKRRTNP